jgi:hypothetical protein
MVGRGTRPAAAIAHGLNDHDQADDRRAMIASSVKPGVDILDFVGNAGKHKLISTADILGGNYEDDVVERARKAASESTGSVDMAEALRAAEKEIAEEIERAKRKALKVKAKWQAEQIDPFDILAIRPQRMRGWETGELASDKQRSLLVKLMGPKAVPDQLTKRHASQLIGECFARRDAKKCSFKQAKILKSRGKPTDVSFAEASRMIDQIAQAEGWGGKAKKRRASKPRKVTNAPKKSYI